MSLALEINSAVWLIIWFSVIKDMNSSSFVTCLFSVLIWFRSFNLIPEYAGQSIKK